MRLSRRDLLNTGLHGAAGLSLLSSAACTSRTPQADATADGQANVPPQGSYLDAATMAFWTSTAREPLESLPDGLPTVISQMPAGGQNASDVIGAKTKVTGGSAKPATMASSQDIVKTTTIANSSSQAAFVFYDDKSGFQPVTRMGKDGLVDKGDTTVTIDVQRVRPSIADRTKFDNLKGGSLRIDLVQNQPLPDLAERLAWTTIAGLYPDAKGKLPSVQELKFDPSTAWGQSKAVKLPGGDGLWRWNFFLQKKSSRWSAFLDLARKVSAPVALAFAMPAYAATALADLDLILGAMQASDVSEWLFRGQSMRVSTTKSTFREGHLPLRSGRYIAVSERQLHLLDSVAANGKPWELSPEGLIVPQGTKGLRVFDEAEGILPELSYLSIAVTVAQA